jgi:hypothetical protein
MALITSTIFGVGSVTLIFGLLDRLLSAGEIGEDLANEIIVEVLTQKESN